MYKDPWQKGLWACKGVGMPLKSKHTLLIVDDEESILKSLQRVFRNENFDITVATGGVEGLRMIKEMDRHFSLIISDQRMPEMMGAQFLAEARKIQPDTMRVLLTGYSDMDAIISAINEGGVHRYLTKPWKDEDLLLQVHQILEQYELILENRHLLELTKKQNEELASLNSGLEEKVKEKTAEILKANEALTHLNRELEANLYNTVKAFGSLVEKHNPLLAGHGRRVGFLTREIVQLMEVPENEAIHIEIAALLHDIGKLGFSQRLLEYKESQWTAEEKKVFESHPRYGHETVYFIKRLDHVGIMVRTHHERYDGRGYPDQLKEEEIPLGARIIAIADVYDKITNLQVNVGNAISNAKASLGNLGDEKLLEAAAILHLKQESFFAYDPDVVKVFLTLLKTKKIVYPEEKKVPVMKLEDGMVLTRPLYSSSGRFLLPQKTVLTGNVVHKLKLLHENDPITDDVYILRK
jgi:response regulator RpfG family c-di-GMP phosphodiesterase